ncbi:MAG: hypothetical protein RIR26_1037 [Pseudomonadota bacterium]
MRSRYVLTVSLFGILSGCGLSKDSVSKLMSQKGDVVVTQQQGDCADLSNLRLVLDASTAIGQWCSDQNALLGAGGCGAGSNLCVQELLIADRDGGTLDFGVTAGVDVFDATSDSKYNGHNSNNGSYTRPPGQTISVGSSSSGAGSGSGSAGATGGSAGSSASNSAGANGSGSSSGGGSGSGGGFGAGGGIGAGIGNGTGGSGGAGGDGGAGGSGGDGGSGGAGGTGGTLGSGGSSSCRYFPELDSSSFGNTNGHCDKLPNSTSCESSGEEGNFGKGCRWVVDRDSGTDTSGGTGGNGGSGGTGGSSGGAGVGAGGGRGGGGGGGSGGGSSGAGAGASTSTDTGSSASGGSAGTSGSGDSSTSSGSNVVVTNPGGSGSHSSSGHYNGRSDTQTHGKRYGVSIWIGATVPLGQRKLRRVTCVNPLNNPYAMMIAQNAIMSQPTQSKLAGVCKK